MENKIPYQNKIIALILSLIFFIALLISLFVFPIELVLLNKSSYYPILDEKDNISQYPKIISEVLAPRILAENSSYQNPKLLSYIDGFTITLEKYIPEEWSVFIFKKMFEKALDLANFRIPDATFDIDISPLKTSLLLDSKTLSSDYLFTLPRCTTLTNEELIEPMAAPDIYQLPPCKPADDLLPMFIDSTALYLENLISKLPSTISASELLISDNPSAKHSFFNYSIIRWGLRLLPIAAIVLLILISELLRREKRLMLGWVGRLLVITSLSGLFSMVVLMIGFDQIVFLIVNRFLPNLVKEFGILLLQILQKVGYLTFIWVLISFIIVLFFGFILLTARRFIKQKNSTFSTDLDNNKDLEINMPLTKTAENEVQLQKAITPETLEDVEEKEMKEKKKK